MVRVPERIVEWDKSTYPPFIWKFSDQDYGMSGVTVLLAKPVIK